MMGAYFAFTQEIVASGEMVAGDPLQGIETASTVTVRGGDTIVTDGPFAETKEVLGGYYIVNVDTRRAGAGAGGQDPRRQDRHGRGATADGSPGEEPTTELDDRRTCALRGRGPGAARAASSPR